MLGLGFLLFIIQYVEWIDRLIDEIKNEIRWTISETEGKLCIFLMMPIYTWNYLNMIQPCCDCTCSSTRIVSPLGNPY